MKRKPKVESTPPEVAPTREQFEEFAGRLIGVPKSEYDELEARRKSERAVRQRRPKTQDGSTS